MTLRHLQIFQTVCEKHSITKASEALNMTQPAVSIAVKELEVFYQTRLFDRIGKKIFLTETGEKLRSYTDRILENFSQSVSDLRNTDHLISCIIGANASIGESILSGLVKKIQQELPDVSLQVRIANNHDMEEKLKNHAIDFALLDSCSDWSYVTAIPICQEEMIAVCAPNFISDNQISNKTLAEIPFLLREKGSGCRTCVDAQLESLGIHPKLAAESISNYALIQLAKTGLGVTILPKSILQEHISHEQLKVLTIKDTKFIRQYYLIFLTQKYLSPAVKRCIKLVRESFPDEFQKYEYKSNDTAPVR